MEAGSATSLPPTIGLAGKNKKHGTVRKTTETTGTGKRRLAVPRVGRYRQGLGETLEGPMPLHFGKVFAFIVFLTIGAFVLWMVFGSFFEGEEAESGAAYQMSDVTRA